MRPILESVGIDGKNANGDVRVIQQLLNINNMCCAAVNGIIGDPAHDQTIAAILAFQSGYMKKPDGLITPGGGTFRRLVQYAVEFDQRSRTFDQRLDAMILDVHERFGLAIAKGSPGRAPEWAQKSHVAHMIKYNSFGGLKPKKFEVVGGRNLLKWAHLERAETTWDGVRWEDFLRTAKGEACKKSADGKSWQTGYAPDETKSRAQAFEILKSSGVATDDTRPSDPNSAMVAPGYQGCKEPCSCGGNRTKHIAGQANDMSPKQTMKVLLPEKFLPPTAASFNKYMALFGLKRPMISESWHVEPIAPCPSS